MIIIVIAICLIGLIFAALGSLVLWQKYVFFSDGLSHASILGISISLVLNISTIYGGIISSIMFASLVFLIQKDAGNNVAISLISSVMLSLALIFFSFNPSTGLENLFYGDIIAVNLLDIIVLSVIAILVMLFVFTSYKSLALISLNSDIAKIQGINVRFIELIFLVLLSISVFLTIRIIGAFLVTIMLIIPAMLAKLISKGPLQMIRRAIIFSILNNLFSFCLSFYFDLPLGPIVVICGIIFYMLINTCKYYINNKIIC